MTPRIENPDDLPDKYAEQIPDDVRVAEASEHTVIEVPVRTPNLNDIINASKTHWSEYKRMKDEIEEQVEVACAIADAPKYNSCHLRITYIREHRQEDPDNICAGKKFLIDGLVSYGVLPDDGWKHIKSFKEFWKVGDEPKVIIKIIGRANND